MKITCVYRRYRYVRGGFNLIVQPEYKRVMKAISKAIAEGKSIEFKHSLCEVKSWKDGTWYDQIEVTIEP